MKNIILLAGPSGTGKTSVAERLEKSGLTVLRSYTTREKRKETDTDHVFISRDEFKALEKDMVAKTDFNGNLYGATSAQVEKSDIYVIDINGIDYFLKQYKGNKIPVIFYLDTDEHTRFCRMILRGDPYEKVKSRIENDRSAFSDETLESICPDRISLDASILKPEDIAELILQKVTYVRKEEIKDAS